MIDLRVLILAVAVAFGGGWFAADKFKAAAEVKELRVEAKQSASNVVQSVAASERIEAAVAKTDDAVTTIKAAVVKRGVTLYPKQEQHHAAPDDRNADGVRSASADGQPNPAENDHVSAPSCGGGDLVLDVGTVGMLDAARQGRALGAAGSDDEAQSAPSAVGVTDLVVNDLEVVRLYLDLAKRHDELVDAVEKKLQDQAR